MQEQDIDYIIKRQSQNIKKNSPFVKNLEVSYEQKVNGLFSTKMKARVKQKNIYLSNKGFCIEDSLKKLFRKLNRVVQRKKYRTARRVTLEYREAV